MKSKIAQSMFDLMKNYPYREISVRIICEAVPVSRPTFYHHFHNKEALIKWIVKQDYFENAVPLFRHHLRATGVQGFFTYVERYKPFYRNLYLFDQGHLLFDSLVYAYDSAVDISSSYSLPSSKEMKRINPDVYRRYSTTGIAAVVTYWVEHDMVIPIENIAGDLYLMIGNPLAVVRDNSLSRN